MTGGPEIAYNSKGCRSEKKLRNTAPVRASTQNSSAESTSCNSCSRTGSSKAELCSLLICPYPVNNTPQVKRGPGHKYSKILTYLIQVSPITEGIALNGSSGSGGHWNGPQTWTYTTPCGLLHSLHHVPRWVPNAGSKPALGSHYVSLGNQSRICWWALRQ